MHRSWFFLWSLEWRFPQWALIAQRADCLARIARVQQSGAWRGRRHVSEFRDFAVEREYLFHGMRASCFPRAGLSQSAERAHAEICDGRSGRHYPATCAFKPVIHVDDAEKELRFRVKF